MKRIFIFLCFFMISTGAIALEIDEKLTMRIVKTSQSRKTILINRGIEDGLVKGDHAKFFLTVGVVARGVVVKLAPTRSVWSVYRLVNADYIKDNQVMKLKITAPVKITKDESKALVSDDSASDMSGDPRDLGIPLAQGANDLAEINQMDKQMNTGQPSQNMTLMESTSLREKTKELFGSIHYSGLAASAAPNDSSGDFKGTSSTLVLNLGGEFYTKDEKSWLSRFSLVAQYSMTKSSTMSHEGTNVTEDASEYGGGIHWYPMTRPSRTYKMVPYARFLMMLGSVNTSYEPGLAGGVNATAENLSGSTVAYTIGAGAKYYIHKGFGARFEFEYYTRGDQFAADANGTKWVTRKSGPRVTMGLSYRW